jgi:hypothetical protein
MNTGKRSEARAKSGPCGEATKAKKTPRDK